MNFKYTLLFLLFAISDHSHALYGARPLARNAMPAIVSLHLADPAHPEFDYFCSGVLVSANKILTAAHCLDVMSDHVYDDNTRLIYEPHHVVVKTNGQQVRAKISTLAPSYYESHKLDGEDLAMIELETSFKSVIPLKIATRKNLGPGATVSMVARQQIAETKILKVNHYFHTSVIYTDGTKSGLCIGDSGGALLTKQNGQFELIGILNFTGKGCDRKPGVAVFPRMNFSY
jgi:secreted trypsin-like serine protease